jgi:hypothetical protein
MGGQYGDIIDQCIEDGSIVLGGYGGSEFLEFPGLADCDEEWQRVRVVREVLDPAFARHYPDFED